MKKPVFTRSTLLSFVLVLCLALSVPGLAFAQGANTAAPTAGEQNDGSQVGDTVIPPASEDTVDKDEGAAPSAPSAPSATPTTPGQAVESGLDEGALTDSAAAAAANSTAAAASAESANPEESAASEEAAEAEEAAGADILAPLDVAYNGAVVTFAFNSKRTQLFDFPDHSLARATQAILYGANSAASQRFRLVQDSDGYYAIININSNMALDIYGSDVRAGTAIVQWPYYGHDNQKWRLIPNSNGSFTIVSKLNSSLCIDAARGSSANGTPLVLWNMEANRPNQCFWLSQIARTIDDGVYTVQAASGATVLDIEGSSYSAGSRALTYKSTQNQNQRFLFRYDSTTGYYTITAVHSNLALDVKGNGLTPGTAVIQWNAHGGTNQKWSLERDPVSGNLFIRAAGSGLSLDVYGGDPNSGAAIIVWRFHGLANQQWILKASTVMSAGTYSLNVASAGWLRVDAASTANGTSISIGKQTSGLNQRFYFNNLGSDIYTIEDLNSGKFLTQESASSSNVVLYEWQGSDTQKWRILPAGNGGFAFQSVAGDGKVLTAASLSSDARVGMGALANAATQSWKAVPAAAINEGLYVFTSALDSGYALDIAAGAQSAGLGLTIWTTNEDKAQRFVVRKVSGNYYQIILLNSGMALDVKGSSLSSTDGSGQVTQWTTKTNGPANQLWKIEYIGNGNVRIVSALGSGRSALTIVGGAATKGAQVGVLNYSGSLAQAFHAKRIANITLEPQNITIERMASLQNGAVYSNGVSWVAASSAQISNRINPTTQSDQMLQFVDLRVPTGLTGAQIDAYINSKADARSIFRGLGATFVAAANKYGINEAYFISHAINETGWGKYVCGDGAFQGFNYDGKTPIGGQLYPAGVYYNFWGIGAYDSNALTGGQNFAVTHGWNSPTAAINGSAKWIAENYIYNGQPTLYDMRWDYTYYGNGGTGNGHKYATDIDWPRKAGQLMQNLYNSTSTPQLYYLVPSYK